MSPHPSEWTNLAWAIVSVISVVVLFCAAWLGKHTIALGKWCYVNGKRLADFFETIETFMKDIAERVGLIEKQIQVNGGRNLRGALDRVEMMIAQEQHVRRRTEHRAVVEREIDANGVSKVTFVSVPWTRITGLTLIHMQEGDWSKCIAPEDRQRVLAAWEEACESKQNFSERYTVVHLENATQTVVRHNEWPHKNPLSVLLGWAGEMIPVYETTKQVVA